MTTHQTEAEKLREVLEALEEILDVDGTPLIEDKWKVHFFDDHYQTIRRALTQHGDAQGWMPIETCPPDVVVLMYCPFLHITNQERIECGVYRNTKAGSQHSWATHWMPLPPAPQPDSKGG